MRRVFQAAFLAVGGPAIGFACSTSPAPHAGGATSPISKEDSAPSTLDAPESSPSDDAGVVAPLDGSPPISLPPIEAGPVDAGPGIPDAGYGGCFAGAYELDAGPDADAAGDTCAYVYACGLGGTSLAPSGCEVLQITTSGTLAAIPGAVCWLPEEAGCDDDAYAPTADGSVTVLCTPCPSGGGRRPVGLRKPRRGGRGTRESVVARYLAAMAFEEDASVAAFARMQRELASLGAPASLVEEAARAERDERRHQRSMATLARGRAGVVARARVRKPAARRAAAVAAENAAEGCVRETYGALLAQWQALHARDEDVQRAFARLARDEARHAALSWAVARWLEPTLDASSQKRVARARARALHALEANANLEPHPALVEAVGLPTAANARALVGAMARGLALA